MRRNRREAQSAPGQGADQKQLQQVPLPIDRAAAVLAGSIDQTLSGIETDRARADLLPQLLTSDGQKLLKAIEDLRSAWISGGRDGRGLRHGRMMARLHRNCQRMG